VSRRTATMLWALVAAACGGEAPSDGVECGDAACTDEEFCLTIYDGQTETLVCTLLPADCETVEQMCFDDPEPCIEDWKAEVCPDNIGGGCSGFEDGTSATCDLPSTTTSYR